MMQGWSQEDYDERKQRQNDGQATDEDRRLIKQYEQAGFTQSRVKEWDAAAERAKQAHEQQATTSETTESGGDLPPRPALNDSRELWVAFAEAVNEQLEPGHRPVEDPAGAKRDALAGLYRSFGPQ